MEDRQTALEDAFRWNDAE
jgi:hypothetical protein